MLLCPNPRELWQASDGEVFLARVRHRPVKRILVGCSECKWCRLARSRATADRAVDEIQFHPPGTCAFLTTTYRPGDEPPGGSLRRRDGQLFIKRLRKRQAGFALTVVSKGEYGEQFGRPHMHFLVYGLRGLDWRSARLMHGRAPRSMFDQGNKPVYVFPWLEDCWGLGFVQAAHIDVGTAGYVCSYAQKRGHVPPSAVIDPATGEPYVLEPEFVQFPSRPGLGFRFFDEYARGIWDTGLRRPGGAIRPVPLAYQRRMKAADPERFEVLKAERAKVLRDPVFRRNNSEYHREARRLIMQAKGALRRTGRPIGGES